MPTNTHARLGKQSISELSFPKSKATTKNRYVGTCNTDDCQKRIDHTFKTQDRRPYRWFRCGRCGNVTLIVLEDIQQE